MRGTSLAIALLWVATAGAETLYRLPWADGLSFVFTQAPGGRITSHFTEATMNAVDIAMPEGVPIVAARGGVVEAVEARYARARKNSRSPTRATSCAYAMSTAPQESMRISGIGASP